MFKDLRRKFSFLAPVVLLAAAGGEGWEMPPAPGPHVSLCAEDLKAVRSFAREDRLVGTYFFYWYDSGSGAHFANPDGSDALVDHPAETDGCSFLSEPWWRKELLTVRAAGIDFILPVFWGVPGEYDGWSFRGLPPLVAAWEALDGEGETPPRVGLFYDTSTLKHNRASRHVDLSTEDGKRWFYATVRDFFSFIPPKMWAAVGGKPIVVLYSAAFARKQDPALFPYVKARFREDFACEPFIVREVSWQGETDAVCAWGGALRPQLYSVSSVGPGYDHHAVPGRAPLVVDREDGAFYERSWRAILERKLSRRARIVLVETWNELHEGTDICETKEYGRKYIELTARWAERFKADEVLPKTGRFAAAKEVSLAFASPEGANGIALREVADGLFEEAHLAGRPCRRTRANEHGPIRYLYFDLDDTFLFDEEGATVTVTLDYLDAGCAAFEVHYDHTDPALSVREGAFAPGPRVAAGNTGEWKRVELKLENGRFSNRTNSSDFRLAVFGGDLAVARVAVEKRPR